MTLRAYLVQIWQNKIFPKNAHDLSVIDNFGRLNIPEKKFQDIKYILEDLNEHCRNVNDCEQEIINIIGKKT